MVCPVSAETSWQCGASMTGDRGSLWYTGKTLLWRNLKVALLKIPLGTSSEPFCGQKEMLGSHLRASSAGSTPARVVGVEDAATGLTQEDSWDFMTTLMVSFVGARQRPPAGPWHPSTTFCGGHPKAPLGCTEAHRISAGGRPAGGSHTKRRFAVRGPGMLGCLGHSIWTPGQD